MEMKTYERPIVLANEELAEGVYAASGAVAGSGCYSVTTNIHQKPETGRGDYRIQVDARHAAGDNHHSGHQTLIMSFNKAVEYGSSEGQLESGNNTATISINYSYHSNASDNVGLGDVVVIADAGLEVNGAVLTCDFDCGQH